ncbi:hypothetical protein BGX33_011997 [Mortierella sp. NVP41]|nr:hypothetical protein BGX33_011997 [Mortierella sp. NVP41]
MSPKTRQSASNIKIEDEEKKGCFEGTLKMKELSPGYFEQLTGRWVLSHDTPGPFAPHELERLLQFLSDQIDIFNKPHAIQFHHTLVVKECAWIETYPQPWEILESVRSTTGNPGERFRMSLQMAFEQPGILSTFIWQREFGIQIKPDKATKRIKM